MVEGNKKYAEANLPDVELIVSRRFTSASAFLRIAAASAWAFSAVSFALVASWRAVSAS